MKTHLCLIASLTCAGLAIAQHPSTCRTEEQRAVDDTQAETKKLNEFIEKSVNWYEILPSVDAQTPLRPLPVSRWRNVARGQEGEAMMVIWCQHGRPEVLASIYPWEGRLQHEFGFAVRKCCQPCRPRQRRGGLVS